MEGVQARGGGEGGGGGAGQGVCVEVHVLVVAALHLLWFAGICPLGMGSSDAAMVTKVYTHVGAVCSM